MTRYPLTRRLGGTHGPGLAGAENLAPNGIRSPDCPARNRSLYRLSYRGPLTNNQDNKIFRSFMSFVRNVSENLLRRYEVHYFAPYLLSSWARESVTNFSDAMTVILTIDTLILRLLMSYIYMELLVKPEMLTSYIYGPTFGNAETVSFYLLHDVSTLNQCREVSCVTFVCKHFAS